MKKFLLITTAVLCTAVFLTLLFCPVHGEEEIYDNVVRLHVLANSDSDEDQALKLRVRDAILEKSTVWMKGCSSREEAATLLCNRQEEIRLVAEEVVRASGRDDRVTVTLDKESYPTRAYDQFCFPAGEYTSLRVSIGNAEGQNWWCCLFPPLCTASSTSTKDAEDAFISVGLTPDQYKVITETEKPVYRVRFKLLELIGDWFS